MTAGSNSITAATLNAGTGSTSSSGSSTLRLGAGTNVINVGAINGAAGRENCTVSFLGSGSGLRLRGTAGGDADRVTTVLLGDRNTGSSTGGTNTGTLSFNGHPVDAKIGTMTLGQQNSAA